MVRPYETDTLVHAAARFCGAPDVLIMRLDDRVLRGAAAVGAFADVLTRKAGSIGSIEVPVTITSRISGQSTHTS